jgi:hypothetical protein
MFVVSSLRAMSLKSSLISWKNSLLGGLVGFYVGEAASSRTVALPQTPYCPSLIQGLKKQDSRCILPRPVMHTDRRDGEDYGSAKLYNRVIGE